jgi:5-methylcytosine-specific restriction endonuclease McrBC regulatory subunit McrC
MAERDDLRWVLDAKYKRAFGNEGRTDRFQMCAYAVAFDADRVSLVYPTAPGVTPMPARTLLTATVGNKMILIDSLDLPMRSGPKACKAVIEQVVRSWSA